MVNVLKSNEQATYFNVLLKKASLILRCKLCTIPYSRNCHHGHYSVIHHTISINLSPSFMSPFIQASCLVIDYIHFIPCLHSYHISFDDSFILCLYSL